MAPDVPVETRQQYCYKQKQKLLTLAEQGNSSGYDFEGKVRAFGDLNLVWSQNIVLFLGTCCYDWAYSNM